jgi:hypothetical protein
MGDGEPTDFAGVTEAETEAAYAWALDDGDELPTQRFTPRRITALGIAGSLVAIAVAAVIVFQVIVDMKRDAAIGHPVLDGEAKSAISGTYIEPPPPPAPVTVTQTVQASAPTPVETIAPTEDGLPTAVATPYDQTFVANIHQRWGFTEDDGTMIHDAAIVCPKLRAGHDLPEISQLMAQATGLTVTQAHEFASEAYLVYPSCHS